MMETEKKPKRMLRLAWGSLIKKASKRTSCTENDNSDHRYFPTDQKTLFQKAPNSS